MRFGYWMPVFGGWLRNVEDEQMEASWAYVSKLARRSEEIGFDLSLIAELNLNDIKGIQAPSLQSCSPAASSNLCRRGIGSGEEPDRRKRRRFVMHGDPPERVAAKIVDMSERRARFNKPPLQFGVSGYAIVRETEAEAKRELARIT